MSSPNLPDLALLLDLLRSPLNRAGLPGQLETELLLKGAVVSLQQDASDEAVAALRETARSNGLPSIQSLALSSLEFLALAQNQAALQALFTLAIEEDDQPAAQVILAHGFRAQTPARQAVFELLNGRVSEYQQIDPETVLLTRFYLRESAPALRNRLLAAAELAGMQNWVVLVTAISRNTPEEMLALLERYAAYRPAERKLALHLLNEAGLDGDELARDALAQLYLHYEDAGARAVAVEHGFTPRDPVQHALFLFLTEQWQAYEVFDFDHRLLITAYETADSVTRKRLLDLSRRSGQLEWFQSLSGANRVRWLGDLSDADWDNTIRRLKDAGRLEDLWRLAQLAAPVWSAEILEILSAAGWQPPSPGEQEQMAVLVELARAAVSAPLTIRPQRSFNIPSMDDLTAVAISPDGKTLALGTSSNAVHLWKVAGNPEPLPILYGAVAQTRSIAFSPDGEYLVTGVGDYSLRVYRLYDQRAIKTLEGHAGLVRALAVSPDQRSLYTGSFDGTIRSWRFPNGPEIKTLHRSEGEIFGLALSPEGDMLVAAGADRTVDVFQLPDGNRVHSMEGHNATVTNLVTAPDTEYVATYSRDHTICVWNYVSGRQIQCIASGNDAVTGLCIHPNEQVLVSAGYKGMIHLYSISTGKPLYELVSHRKAVIGLALSPDGATLISASVDGAVTLWSLDIFLQTRQPVETVRPSRAGEIQQRLEQKTLTPAEHNWLAFTLELLRWKQRFDVQIEAARTISIGEFDIQL